MLLNNLRATHGVALSLMLSVPLLATGCASPGKDAAVESKPDQTPVAATTGADAGIAQTPRTGGGYTTRVVEINPSAPEEYIVQPGDTLWDISSQFLKEPWFWPEIWDTNPQIENPHLIFPGDVLTLYYIGGRPRLEISGGPRVTGPGVTRLSPQIRSTPLDGRDQVIPIQAIQSMLIYPLVLTQKQLDEAPYVVGGEDYRLIFGNDDRVYVRDLETAEPKANYRIMRQGEPLTDPKTGEFLGFEGIPVADARLVRDGDPATLDVYHAKREVLIGDRLFAYEEQEQDTNFFPHPAPEEIDASVVSLYNAITMIGGLQIGVVNAGLQDGVDRGSVLAVYESGEIVRDPFASGKNRSEIRLPEEKAGIMMVFRAFDRLSYALVMDAQRPIRQGDGVRSP